MLQLALLPVRPYRGEECQRQLKADRLGNRFVVEIGETDEVESSSDVRSLEPLAERHLTETIRNSRLVLMPG